MVKQGGGSLKEADSLTTDTEQSNVMYWTVCIFPHIRQIDACSIHSSVLVQQWDTMNNTHKINSIPPQQQEDAGSFLSHIPVQTKSLTHMWEWKYAACSDLCSDPATGCNVCNVILDQKHKGQHVWVCFLRHARTHAHTHTHSISTAVCVCRPEISKLIKTQEWLIWPWQHPHLIVIIIFVLGLSKSCIKYTTF